MKSTMTNLFYNTENNEINRILKIYDMNDKKVLAMRAMPYKRRMVAGSVASLNWRHKPSYGLTDYTLIEPAQNPFQLALKPGM